MYITGVGRWKSAGQLNGVPSTLGGPARAAKCEPVQTKRPRKKAVYKPCRPVGLSLELSGKTKAMLFAVSRVTLSYPRHHLASIKAHAVTPGRPAGAFREPYLHTKVLWPRYGAEKHLHEGPLKHRG